MSASLTYPPMYPSPDSLLAPAGYLHRSATHQPTLETYQRSPLNNAIISPNLSSVGDPNAVSGGATRHYGHQHSASSPYAHAYASRRGHVPTAKGMMSSPNMTPSAFSGAMEPVITPTAGHNQLESQPHAVNEERQRQQGQGG